MNPRTRLVALGLLLSTPALAQSGLDEPTRFSASDRIEQIQRSSSIEFSVGTFQMFDSTKVFRYDDECGARPSSA